MSKHSYPNGPLTTGRATTLSMHIIMHAKANELNVGRAIARIEVCYAAVKSTGATSANLQAYDAQCQDSD